MTPSAMSDAGACGGMPPSAMFDAGSCGGMTPSVVSDAGACGGMTPSAVSDVGACGGGSSHIVIPKPLSSPSNILGFDIGSNSKHTPINLQPVRQARMHSTHHIGPSALHPMTPSSPAAHTIKVAPLEESDEDPSDMMLESEMNDMVEAIFEATDPTADDMKQEARRQTPSSSRVQETAEHTPSGTQESTPEGTPLAHRRQLPEGYSYLVDASRAIIMTPKGKEVISAMRRLCPQVFRHTVMQTFAAQCQDLKDYVIDTLYHDFPMPTPGDRFGREYMLLHMREYLKHRRDDARRATQRPDWLDKEEWRKIREERVTAPDRWEQQRRVARARIDAGSLQHLGSGGWGSFDEDFQVTTGRAASMLERSLGAQHGLAWVIELLDRRGGESPYTEPLTRTELPDPPQLVRAQLAGILTYRLHEKVIKVPNARPLPPPPPKVLSNAYTLFFDGAFRRATGKAGGGLVLVNPEGEVVMKEQVTLDGSTSNNEAEYDILISGLKICLAQKIRRLMLYHIPRKENEDAKLLVQQAVSNQDKAHMVIAAIALKDSQYAGMESLTPVVNYILEGEFPKEFKVGQRRKLIKQASPFLWLERALYQKGKDFVCRKVPSTNEIPKFLKGLHEEACGGHFSHELTLKKVLLVGYVWPSMHANVQHWCKSCHNCQVNGNKRLLYGPRQAVIANGPFEKWGIDAMGPLPRTTNGKLNILVAIDYMTRRIEAQSVAKVNEKTVSKFVYTHICCRFGTPLEIVSDNGPGFRRGLLTEVCEELKISHRHSTPYYPQSNGLVEKANGIIASIIRKMVESKPKRWDNFLDGAIWAYRTTYRDATQFTPFHLVYGQEALQPIELNIPTIKLTGRQEKHNDEAWIDRLLNLVELEWKREAAYHCYKKKPCNSRTSLMKESKTSK
ncbi:hypothetical protein L7F22_034003 [Adiantum nelumboides]|nr:hypothetical protein [Adiantum nelumboides]